MFYESSEATHLRVHLATMEGWREVGDDDPTGQAEAVADRPTRRDERTGRSWPVYTLEEVAQHAHKDDCWIVVHDIVYDMTPHVRNHEGWTGAGKISTLIALLAAMGTDCTHDFDESHGPDAVRQMPVRAPHTPTRPLSLAVGRRDARSPVSLARSSPALRVAQAFKVGVLDKPNRGNRWVTFMTWDQIQASGRVDERPAASTSAR